jgi:SAM-dependent methyltransferase
MLDRLRIERRIRDLLPKRARPFLASAYYGVLDLVSARRDPLTPPRRLLRLSTDPESDFRATGSAFARYVFDDLDLGPGSAVLDVGCGVGRLAVGLTPFLGPEARYEGFDIIEREVAWCQRQITPRFPRFRFQVADIFNKTYHPSGRLRASEFRFPYDQASFDAVVVGSVFTHLLPDDATHYVREIARVLRPGGRVLASFYLLNDRSCAGIDAGTSAFSFAFDRDVAKVDDDDRPELAVAYGEDEVRGWFERSELSVESCLPGEWSTAGTQSQDLITARRR